MNSFQSTSSEQGRAFEEHVRRILIAQGFDVVEERYPHPDLGNEIDFVAVRPGDEHVHWIECKGSWRSNSNGLERVTTVKVALGVAWRLSTAADRDQARYVIATSDLPKPGSLGDGMLRDAITAGIVDAVWTVPLTFEEWRP